MPSKAANWLKNLSSKFDNLSVLYVDFEYGRM